MPTFIKSYQSEELDSTAYEVELDEKTSMPLSEEILSGVVGVISREFPDIPYYLIVAQKDHGKKKFSTVEVFLALENQRLIPDADVFGNPVSQVKEFYKKIEINDYRKTVLIWVIDAMNNFGNNAWSYSIPLPPSTEEKKEKTSHRKGKSKEE